jgi:hypothetical protein
MTATNAAVTNRVAEVIPAIPPVEMESSPSSDALGSTSSLSMTVKVEGLSLGNDEVLSILGVEVGRNVSLIDGEELGVVMSILEGGIDGTEVTSKEGEFVKPVIGELVGALEE